MRDDGAEQTALFTVAGKLADGRELPPVQVPAADFAGHGLGDDGLARRGRRLRRPGDARPPRAAIELLSADRARRTVYAHTGWRQIGDAWHYLHGGGAIGPDGAAAGVEVSLPDPLAGFRLPDPPTGEGLAAAVRASLALLDGLAPDRIAFPLVGGRLPCGPRRRPRPHRPGLAPGRPARRRQERAGGPVSAALRRRLWTRGTCPAVGPPQRTHWRGWRSPRRTRCSSSMTTPRAGRPADRQRLERDADRLLAGQGNRAGRQRMRADGSLRPARPPRGLILSTGEDVPPGQSLRGRMLILEVSPGDVPLARLTPHQHAAGAGLYAQALAGFVRWLAPQYGELCDRLPARAGGAARPGDDRRRVGADPRHRRRPGPRAETASSTSPRPPASLDDAERGALARRGWQALQQAAGGAGGARRGGRADGPFPASAGRGPGVGPAAYVAGPDGSEPTNNPQGWGWRERTYGLGAQGPRRWLPARPAHRLGGGGRPVPGTGGELRGGAGTGPRPGRRAAGNEPNPVEAPARKKGCWPRGTPAASATLSAGPWKG